MHGIQGAGNMFRAEQRRNGLVKCGQGRRKSTNLSKLEVFIEHIPRAECLQDTVQLDDST